MVHEPLDPVTVQVKPPGDAVTVYEVGVPPPVPAATVTVAVVPLTVTVGFSGVPGAGSTAVGAAARLCTEGPDVPLALPEETVNV